MSIKQRRAAPPYPALCRPPPGRAAWGPVPASGAPGRPPTSAPIVPNQLAAPSGTPPRAQPLDAGFAGPGARRSSSLYASFHESMKAINVCYLAHLPSTWPMMFYSPMCAGSVQYYRYRF